VHVVGAAVVKELHPVIRDIYPKSCTSRYWVNLISSGKCGIIHIAQGRQIWESDTQQS
jgi:hypothetical protein